MRISAIGAAATREPTALTYLPEAGKYFDFPSLVLRLLEAEQRVSCYPNDAMWLDIGRREDHLAAAETFEKHLAEFGVDPRPLLQW